MLTILNLFRLVNLGISFGTEHLQLQMFAHLTAISLTLDAVNPPHIASILPTVAVPSTDHVLRDAAVKRLAAVAFLRRDDGQRDRAEGGGDLARVGAGVAPAGHSTHRALGDGGPQPRQQGDGDVAVQKDGSLQLERRRTVGSVSSGHGGQRTERCSGRGWKPTLISMMSWLLVVLLYLGCGTRSWGRISCSVPS